MIAVCLSDLHGSLPYVKESDLLILAGDYIGNKIKHDEDWILGVFTDWLKDCASRTKFGIVAIAGNHDEIFEERPKLAYSLPWTYLCDETVTINGRKFYGSPWQPVFYDWAFNLTEKQLAKKYAEIPEGLDVLISHGPPRGFCDKTRGISVGSTSLTAAIKTKEPKFVVCGHIHDGRGRATCGKSEIINCSVLNDQYIEHFMQYEVIEI